MPVLDIKCVFIMTPLNAMGVVEVIDIVLGYDVVFVAVSPKVFKCVRREVAGACGLRAGCSAHPIKVN